MGSWKYNAGLLLVLTVVVIWVASAEVTQDIFEVYDHPFALTWLGASLLVLHLPFAILRDWVASCLTRCKRKWRFTGIDLETAVACAEKVNSSGGGSGPGGGVLSPARWQLRNKGAVELQHLLQKKASDQDMSRQDERQTCRSLSDGGGLDPSFRPGLTTWDGIKMGLYLAPLWFLTEYLANASLAMTSVASTTILSSTSALWTLIFGVMSGQDSFNMTKIISVLVSLIGVVMTTMGTTWAPDEAQKLGLTKQVMGLTKGVRKLPGIQKDLAKSIRDHSLIGDSFGLMSAICYGIFTVLLKRFAGDEGSHVDLQKVFGYVGFFTLFGLWWLVYPLTFFKLEPKFSIPKSLGIREKLLLNGLIGSVASDYFWALSVVWTTPLVATLGMSLTIPLAMVADMLYHRRHYSAIYILGSVQVFAGFIIASMNDTCKRKLGVL